MSVTSNATCQEPKLAIVAMDSGGRFSMKEGTCAGHVSSGPNCKWRYMLFAAVNLICLTFLIQLSRLQEILFSGSCAKIVTSQLSEEQQGRTWGQTHAEFLVTTLHMGGQGRLNRTKRVGPMDVQSQLEQLLIKVLSQQFQHQAQP